MCEEAINLPVTAAVVKEVPSKGEAGAIAVKL
jgi:hypothetical protein